MSDPSAVLSMHRATRCTSRAALRLARARQWNGGAVMMMDKGLPREASAFMRISRELPPDRRATVQWRISAGMRVSVPRPGRVAPLRDLFYRGQVLDDVAQLALAEHVGEARRHGARHGEAFLHVRFGHLLLLAI